MSVILHAVIHYLATEYKWSIEYIMDLTRPQIRALMSGAKYLHDQTRPAAAPEPSKRFPAKRKATKPGEHKMKNVSGDQLDSLLSMPGLKLSPKSLAKLQYLRSKRAQENSTEG